MTHAPNDRDRRAARQLIDTSRLLGVEFVPIAHAPAPAPTLAATSAPAPPITATNAPARATPAAESSREEKAAALARLRSRHDAECPHCTSVTHHTQTVFADGDPAAALMFVGEAPGEEEDRQGIPFVGRAGQLLNDMIRAMGLKREEVYIANVLKARPPNNATPTPDEAAKCGPYLLEQIAIVQPRAIVTLGNPATHFLLSTTRGITTLRGSWQDFRGIPVMPTFHPAYLLRQYTPENRGKVWSDLQQVMLRLKGEA